MATLSTPVGAPSLGNYIFGGLQTRNAAAILTGCVAAAVLALVLDGLVRAIAAGLAARRRPGPLLAGVLGLVVLAGWAFLPLPRAAGDAARPIVVGAKTFTEQYVLAEILAATVRAETRLPARTLTSLGSTVAFDALKRDEIDLYVDYTGTLWATVMGRKGPAGPREAMNEELRRWLREEAGVNVAARLGFENAYCFAVRPETAARLALRTLGDLSRHAPRLSLASDYEFFAREEWRAVEAAYGLRFREKRTMDPSLLYQAIEAGQVDAITAYSSDGRIQALGLVVLEDDKAALPPYDAVVLASPRLAREHPRVLAAAATLDSRIDVATMRALNRRVDEQGETPAAVAAAFVAGAPAPK
jgi:osmoprotectant transport system permease protein